MTGDAPRSLHSGPEQSPGFLLWRTTLLWQRRVRNALAPFDLTHVQFVLLTTLWWLGDHEEPPTQTRLAEQAATDAMMTSQVLRRLERRELLERQADPSDARARRLLLTPTGRALVAVALRAVEDADRAYFATLGARQSAFVADLATLANE
jgi:DNA-binding MarR family transcriptional regulator